MTTLYLHELPDWEELLRVVAGGVGLAPEMVEKDYWVVHSLWAIRKLGWLVHLKGGTSLSKGYGVINRFSEDLDLRLDPPTEWALAKDHNWKSQGRLAIRERRDYFERLAVELRIPGCRLLVEERDVYSRAIKLRVEYREVTGSPPPPLSGGVLLELGNARIVPSEARPIQSWAMKYALAQGDGGFLKVPPVEIQCIRPEVTLLEKLEAIARRYPGQRPAGEIIRHFEDCASIIAYLANGEPEVARGIRCLYLEMIETRDLRLDYASHPSLYTFDRVDRNEELQQAWMDVDPMHWGDRRSIFDCMRAIRKFCVNRLRLC